MADNINNIVGQGAFDDIKKLQTELASLVASFTNTTASIAEMESKLSASKSLKEWASALKMVTDAESNRAREERLAQKDENSIVNKRIKDQKDYIKSLEQQLAKKEEIRKKEVLASQQAINASKKEEEQRRKNLSDALSAINAINEAEEKANQDRIRREKERANSISVYDNVTAPNNSNNLANQFDTNIANQAKEAKDFSNQLKQSILEEIELEKKRRDELAKTAKERRTERTLNLASIKEQKDLQKEVDKADKDTLGGYKEGASVSIYQNARKELANLRDVANSLRLQFERAAKSGQVTDGVLKNMAINADNAEKAWKELNGQLDSVEGRTGGSTRGYNAMLTETNQLLRELPNFAISARTGILSISNNLPMFIEAWQRTASSIDETTNRARGFRGAMSELGKALMSWQTIAIVAIGLMIQYSDEIVDFVTSTSDAEKAMRKLDENTKEATLGYSRQISILLQYKTTLTDTTSTIDAKRVALSNLKEEFSGYFDDLTTIDKLNSDINKKIEEQIDLLKQRAKEEASAKVAEELTRNLIEAELELEKVLKGNTSAWKTFLYYATNGAGVITQEMIEMEKTYNSFTDANKRLYDEQRRLKEQGKISTNTFFQVTKAIIETEKQANNLTNTMSSLANEMARNDLYVSSTVRTMSDLDLRLLEAETNLKKFARGSKAWSDAGRNVEKYRKELELAKLADEFGGTEQTRLLNREYVIRRNAIMQEDINAYRETAEKKERVLWDWQKAEKEVLDAMAKTRFEIQKAELESEANTYEVIYKDENKSLSERLNALDKFYVAKSKVVNAELEKELEAIENGLERKKSIEEKLGREINSIEDLQSLEREGKITSEQKNFLANALNYANERFRIEKQLQKNLSDLRKDTNSSKNDIFSSDMQVRMANYADRLKASTDKVLANTNTQIAEWNKLREEGVISERRYWELLEQTINDEGDKVLIANLEFIKEFKQAQFSSQMGPLTTEEQAQFDAYINSLDLAIANARRKISKPKNKLTMFELITGSSFKDATNSFIGSKELKLTDADAQLATSIYENAFASMFDSLNQMWANYYEKRKVEIDEQERVNDKWVKDEENRVNSSLMTQEEKEKALQKIDGQRLANEQELDRRRRELARKQAEDEKNQAILSATLSFSTGIMQVWSKWAAVPIVAVPLTAALSVAFATQMAAIHSAPIPAYERGTPKDGHKGGIALVGEKRRELVVTPDGNLFYTPSTPTLMNLPKGAHVLPNPDAMSNMAKSEALARLNGGNGSEVTSSSDIIGYKLDNLSNIIRNKQENHIFLQNGELKKFVRKANTRINWVNK